MSAIYPLPATVDSVPRDASIALLASGGVDSSVALHMLVEAGFKPTLFYIRIGMVDEEGLISCTAEEDLEMVSLLARKYQLQYEEINLHTEYWERVVSYTINSVKAGFTPNPDVMCNKLIKFGLFEEQVGCKYDYIASGHYASTELIEGKVYLATSPDAVKDQTDFLAQVNLKQLSKILFPLGMLDKHQVRQLAIEAHLPNAGRKDSQGICFLGKINYNQFLERYLGRKEGDIIELETGKSIGKHNGYWFHTIGQRKGLGLSGGPWFVVKKNRAENVVFVSRGYDPITQYGTKIYCQNFDFITEDPFSMAEAANPLPITFKVRHTPEFTKGLFFKEEEGFRIESEVPIQGIAPGQFAVIYNLASHICLGSGAITSGV